MDVQSTNTQSFGAGAKSGTTTAKSGGASGSTLAQLASSFANALIDATGVRVSSNFSLPIDKTNGAPIDESSRPHYDRKDAADDAPVRETERPKDDDRRSDHDASRDRSRDDSVVSRASSDEQGYSRPTDESNVPQSNTQDDANTDKQAGQSDRANSESDATRADTDTHQNAPSDASQDRASDDAPAQNASGDAMKTAFNQAHENLIATAQSSQGGSAVREAAHAQVAATPGHVRQAQRAGQAENSSATTTGGPSKGADATAIPAASAENAAQASNTARGTQTQGPAQVQGQAQTQAQTQSQAGATSGATGSAAQAGQQAASTEAMQTPETTRSQQAAGLARAMGGNERANVNVSVTDASAATQSRPTHTLTQALPPEVETSGTATEQRASAGNRPTTAQIAAGTPSTHGQATGAEALANTAAQQKGQTAQQNFRAMAVDAKSVGRAAATSGQPAQVQTSAPEISSSTTAGTAQPAAETSQTARAIARPQMKPDVPARHVSEQISVQISKAVKAGIDRINIQLKPASLGRIEIQLEMASNGRLSATVIVDRPDTLDMMRNDSRGLEKSLQQAGLNLDAGGMNFNLRGQQNNHGAQQGNGSNSGHDFGDEALPNEASDIADAATADATQQRAERAADRGGVDIQA